MFRFITLAFLVLTACADVNDGDCPEGQVPTESPDADLKPGTVYGDCAPAKDAVEGVESALVTPFPTMVEPYVIGLSKGWYSNTSHWLNKALQGFNYAHYSANFHESYLNVPEAYKCQLAVNAASCAGRTYICPHLVFGNIRAYVMPNGSGKVGIPSGFQVRPSEPIPASLIRKEANRLICNYTMSGYISYKLTRITQTVKK